MVLYEAMKRRDFFKLCFEQREKALHYLTTLPYEEQLPYFTYRLNKHFTILHFAAILGDGNFIQHIFDTYPKSLGFSKLNEILKDLSECGREDILRIFLDSDNIDMSDFLYDFCDIAKKAMSGKEERCLEMLLEKKAKISNNVDLQLYLNYLIGEAINSNNVGCFNVLAKAYSKYCPDNLNEYLGEVCLRVFAKNEYSSYCDMALTLINLGVEVMRKYKSRGYHSKSIFRMSFGYNTFGYVPEAQKNHLMMMVAQNAYREIVSSFTKPRDQTILFMRKIFRTFNSLVCIALQEHCLPKLRLLYALFRKVFYEFSLLEDEEVDGDLEYPRLTLNFLSPRFFSKLEYTLPYEDVRNSLVQFLFVTGFQKTDYIDDHLIREKAAKFNRNTTLFDMLYVLFQIQDLETQINS